MLIPSENTEDFQRNPSLSRGTNANSQHPIYAPISPIKSIKRDEC